VYLVQVMRSVSVQLDWVLAWGRNILLEIAL
jgi:hypothetical protein